MFVIFSNRKICSVPGLKFYVRSSSDIISDLSHFFFLEKREGKKTFFLEIEKESQQMRNLFSR